MKYENELRTINTQEKAYLLGFMYGDGCISKYLKKDSKNYIYATRISININDCDLINKLHEEFQFFNIGTFDYKIYNENTGEQISLTKQSKELYNDFLLNGLYPRKSYENKNLLKLPNIVDVLMPHFIRGFFDADGSVYTQTNRPNLIRIEFCSVSKSFIYELNDYLKELDINSWEITETNYIDKQSLYKITFTRTEETMKLINYMYKDANIKMERKAIKCLEYKPVDKVADRGLLCIICDKPITKNGTRGNSIRYKCKHCGNNSSIKIV